MFDLGKLKKFMPLSSKIRANSHFIIFTGFFVLHLLLLNVNRVEWGDSYRILRASEYARDFSYPVDEKRPPLYSVFLALRPLTSLDPVLWGKISMLLVSLLCFYLFYKITCSLFKGKKELITFSLLLFAFNPVYFYWSLRIYADVFFSSQVLLLVYLYLKWKDNLKPTRLIVLAFVSVLAIITRFEGYLLSFSLGLGILFLKKFPSRKDVKNFLEYSFFILLLLVPYWLWKNPLNSSYFSEPSGRTYDFTMVLKYFLSLFFLFGFTLAPAFLFVKLKRALSFFKGYVFLAVFVISELLLILIWPAAIPRLFVPILPLLIWPLVQSINFYFGEKKSNGILFVLYSLVFLCLYFCGQLFVPLQFLIPSLKMVLVVFLLNLIGLVFIYLKNYIASLTLIVISMLFWTLSVIYFHKDIYSTIRSSVDYANANLEGVIAYNDSSSVSDWYLNESPNSSNKITGKYFEYGSSDQLSLENLKEKGYDYLLFTNEHNPFLEVAFEKRPYLEVVRSFEKEINGTMSFTKVVKVKN